MAPSLAARQANWSTSVSAPPALSIAASQVSLLYIGHTKLQCLRPQCRATVTHHQCSSDDMGRYSFEVGLTTVASVYYVLCHAGEHIAIHCDS